jgi:hypothetical protein
MATETQEVVVTGKPVSRRNAPEPEMKQYKLREGCSHYMDGELVGVDEEIGLTDAEYAAFSDKFVPTGKGATKSRRSGKLDKGVEDVETPGEGDGNPPPPTPQRVSHTPQDIGGRTPDLDAPQANPGNATRGTHGPRVAGGVPVRAEALQSASEPAKGETAAGKDGPVKEGQVQPIRDVVQATNSGGAGADLDNEKLREAAEKSDAKGSKK